MADIDPAPGHPATLLADGHALKTSTVLVAALDPAAKVPAVVGLPEAGKLLDAAAAEKIHAPSLLHARQSFFVLKISRPADDEGVGCQTYETSNGKGPVGGDARRVALSRGDRVTKFGRFFLEFFAALFFGALLTLTLMVMRRVDERKHHTDYDHGYIDGALSCEKKAVPKN